MIQEIRSKTKQIRELDEKIETYKSREQQMRETCEAWKKEVDIVREQLEGQLTRQKTDHDAVMSTIQLTYGADAKRIKQENQDLQERLRMSTENNELLRKQLMEKTAPPPIYGAPPPHHGGPPPVVPYNARMQASLNIFLHLCQCFQKPQGWVPIRPVTYVSIMPLTPYRRGVYNI